MELKFRAFVRQQSGRNLYLQGKKWQFIFGLNLGKVMVNDGAIQFEVNPDAVDICTGFRDWAGKEIYENDILYDRHDIKYGVVEMNDGQWQIRWPGGCVSLFETNSYIEIVGTIHDKAELINSN